MAGYKGFTYDELVKPLESVQKAHNEVITDMASLSQNSEILDYYLDPNRDKEACNLYNKFKDELNFNVDDFARNGLTRNNGMKLLSLHRNYNNNVANVLDAVKSREADRAQQQKLQEQSKGQAIFGLNGTDGDANIRSVDFYLQGNKGFAYQNLDEVRDEAMKFASAASKRRYKNSLDDPATMNMKAFANQYWRKMEETGYNDRASWNIINQLMDMYEPIIDGTDDGKNSGEHPEGFIANMRRMLNERNIDQFSDRDKTRLINAYINGIDEGLTYIPKEELKETLEFAKARAPRTYNNYNPKGSGETFVNPDDSRSVTDYNTAVSKFKNENANEQKSLTESLLNSPFSVAVNVGGVTKHRLASFTEFMKNKGCIIQDGKWWDPSKGYGQAQCKIPSGKNGEKIIVPKHIYYEYHNMMNKITDTYHLNKGDGTTPMTADIKTLINPQTSNEYLESALQRFMDINDRDAKPHKFVSTQMRIDQSAKNQAVGNALARLGPQSLKTEVGYDPKTRTYFFSGEDRKGTIKNALYKENLNNGCDISLVYLPQSKHDQSPLWVMVKSMAKDESNQYVPTVYIPLSEFTSDTDNRIANQENNLAINRREILRREAEVLNINSNISIGELKNLISEYKKIEDPRERETKLDAAYQIMESIEYIDYYIHRRNLTADDGNMANRTIKQVIDDLNEADKK